MSTFLLYFLLVVPGLKGMFGFLAFLSGIALVVSIGIQFATYEISDEARERWKAMQKWLIPTFIISAPLSVLIPSLKVMLILIGYDAVTSIEGIDALPAEVVDYMRNKFKGN